MVRMVLRPSRSATCTSVASAKSMGLSAYRSISVSSAGRSASDISRIPILALRTNSQALCHWSRTSTIARMAPVSTRSLWGTPLARSVLLFQNFTHDLAHLGVGGRTQPARDCARGLQEFLAQPALLLGVLLRRQLARAFGQPLAHHPFQDGGDVGL